MVSERKSKLGSRKASKIASRFARTRYFETSNKCGSGGVSTSNTGAVLDGDIDQFTQAALAQKAFGTAPKHVEDVE